MDALVAPIKREVVHKFTALLLPDSLSFSCYTGVEENSGYLHDGTQRRPVV